MRFPLEITSACGEGEIRYKCPCGHEGLAAVSGYDHTLDDADPDWGRIVDYERIECSARKQKYTRFRLIGDTEMEMTEMSEQTKQEKSIVKCPDCGNEMPENAKFCAKCGKKLEQKAFCLNCGAALIPGMASCAACGTKAGSSPAAARATSAAPGDGDAITRYKRVWFVEGKRKLMNAPWFTDLDIYPDRLEYKKNFTAGNPVTGGLGALANSTAKAKKQDYTSIPYASIDRITYAKESKMDGQKLIHVYTKNGTEIHFSLPAIHTRENEPLYQKLLSLAAPYMNK